MYVDCFTCLYPYCHFLSLSLSNPVTVTCHLLLLPKFLSPTFVQLSLRCLSTAVNCFLPVTPCHRTGSVLRDTLTPSPMPNLSPFPTTSPATAASHSPQTSAIQDPPSVGSATTPLHSSSSTAVTPSPRPLVMQRTGGTYAYR